MKLLSHRSIIIFRTLYESGIASKAATNLGISQSGVSRSIAELEKKVGLRLFLRKKNRLLATPEAEFLYKDTDTVTRAFDVLDRNLESMRQYGIAKIHFATIPALGDHYAPRLLTQSFPALSSMHLHFEINSTTNIIHALEAGLIDLAIVTLPIQTKALIQDKVISSTAVCILNNEHPLSKKSSIHVTDFRNQHLIIANQPKPWCKNTFRFTAII